MKNFSSNRIRSYLVFFCAVAHAESNLLGQFDLTKMVTGKPGRLTYHSKPVPHDLVNSWPQQLENDFQRRAQNVILKQRNEIKPGVNTYFENEKRSYGYLMAHVLGGNAEVALKYLQATDHQHDEWHRETSGIDYFACFTLKHQMRKYFYFGDLLTPDYRKKMFDGAKRWTQKDPMRRPHYAHQPGKQGWGPDAKNSWVDVRSTENLWLMRTTSVYLMAEETGNEATRKLYGRYLLDYARTLYRIGIGEWDSENYHGHSIIPLLNLYDFAKDTEVKAAAKACLDFYAISGAIKYWRGGFNGPTKRDYNHAQPFGGSAANSLWMWFGGHPTGKVGHWESDEVHQVTSAYRPPLAAVNLANKKFKKPVEIFAAKPAYDATTSFRLDSKPEYLETQYIAHTYQMGSLTSGTSVDGGDVNGFKMLVFDQDDGAVTLQATPGANPAYPGSPMYKKGVVSAENRVAQQENIAIWLVKDGKSPWLWVVPEQLEISEKQGVTFIKCDRTWVAIRPLATSVVKHDSELTAQLLATKKNGFVEHKVLASTGNGKNYCGLAIEVGEQQSHGSFDRFVKSVLAAEVDVGELHLGVVRYKAAEGKYLGIHWNDNPLDLGVWCNGKRRDLANAKLFESPLVQAEWGKGILEVRTQGAVFKHEVK